MQAEGGAECEGALPCVVGYAFSPAKISFNCCMARTWNGGHGGQCTRAPEAGSDFCGAHDLDDRWGVHGRVDGPVPAAKLREFERASRTSYSKSVGVSASLAGALEVSPEAQQKKARLVQAASNLAHAIREFRASEDRDTVQVQAGRQPEAQDRTLVTMPARETPTVETADRGSNLSGIRRRLRSLSKENDQVVRRKRRA